MSKSAGPAGSYRPGRTPLTMYTRTTMKAVLDASRPYHNRQRIAAYRNRFSSASPPPTPYNSETPTAVTPNPIGNLPSPA